MWIFKYATQAEFCVVRTSNLMNIEKIRRLGSGCQRCVSENTCALTTPNLASIEHD